MSFCYEVINKDTLLRGNYTLEDEGNHTFEEKEPNISHVSFANIYVKGIPKSYNQTKLKSLFETKTGGAVISCKYMENSKGTCAILGFAKEDDGPKAVNLLHGKIFKDDGETVKLYVAKYKSKLERQAQVFKQQINLIISNTAIKNNLYVKHLSPRIDNSTLRQLFSRFGDIISAKVMCNDLGVSKGFGFVCFKNAGSAAKAYQAMDGVLCYGQKLYVNYKQSKEERAKIAEYKIILNQFIGSCSYFPPTVKPSNISVREAIPAGKSIQGSKVVLENQIYFQQWFIKEFEAFTDIYPKIHEGKYDFIEVFVELDEDIIENKLKLQSKPRMKAFKSKLDDTKEDFKRFKDKLYQLNMKQLHKMFITKGVYYTDIFRKRYKTTNGLKFEMKGLDYINIDEVFKAICE